jgi:peptidoglycan/LPS O-acetylase OafA/YrhL
MGERRNNFDALRLGAALSVVLTHAFLTGENRIDIDPLMLLTRGQCSLGVAGVFVFFTISGYLVTGSFCATGSALLFIMKRALRIYPGLALCLVVSALVLGPAVTSLPLGAYLANPSSYGYVAANLAMQIDWNDLPGVHFSAFPAGHVVDGPLWSLPCEVVMYLLVAALGALGLLRLPVVGALIAAGLACIWFDTASSGTTLGGALWLLAFFAAGMALYLLRERKVLRWPLAVAALALVAAGATLNFFIASFAIGGSYLVIYAAFVSRRVIPAARWGDLSYGLYIYGWPAEQAVVRTLGGAAPWWEVFALALPAALACAFVSWHLVEAPALRLKPRAARPAETAAA